VTGDACDLLLTDVVMPEMNGRELAGRIRERVPELHVVYISGYSPGAVLDGGRLDPAEFFLQKPFTATELGAIVREALDAAAAPGASSDSKQPATVITSATITCPECGTPTVEVMPTDACQFFYTCPSCDSRLRSLEEDCCVFCSYSDQLCPPKQSGEDCC
jgi:hypothetical protein